jgi:hypothetical protein
MLNDVRKESDWILRGLCAQTVGEYFSLNCYDQIQPEKE